jgi:hypothetical protein
MTRKLYEIAAILLLGATVGVAAMGASHNATASWILAAASCVVFGILTLAEFLPVTSLNLTVEVTPKNAPHIEPVARELIALIKAYTMMLMFWVGEFIVRPASTAWFWLAVGAILVALFGAIVSFRIKVRKLA